jgi:hypothetical protein
MESIDNIVIVQKRLIEIRSKHGTFFCNFLHVIGNQDVFLYFVDITFEPFATIRIRKIPLSNYYPRS